MMASMLDWGNVDSACERMRASLSLSEKREAFSLLCLSEILRIDFDEARGALTDGPDDRGIDAAYIEDRSGVRTVHLFQFKFHTTFENSKRNFPSSELDKISCFVNDCFSQTQNFLQTCNHLLRQKVIDIWSFIASGSTRVRIHLCSNGSILAEGHLSRFEESLQRYKYFSVTEHSLDSLSDALAQRTNSDRKVDLKLLDEQLFERTDGNVRAVIGTVRADDFLASFTDSRDPLRLDPSLFEEPVYPLDACRTKRYIMGHDEEKPLCQPRV
jgi:hypothetical protein